jgi:hypothetical protein
MKILEKKDWDYILYEEENDIYIEVLCGTVGVFEVKVKLSENDKNTMKKDPDFINKLAEEIRLDPHGFNRNRQ